MELKGCSLLIAAAPHICAIDEYLPVWRGVSDLRDQRK